MRVRCRRVDVEETVKKNENDLEVNNDIEKEVGLITHNLVYFDSRTFCDL